jgi:hypothetical protein
LLNHLPNVVGIAGRCGPTGCVEGPWVSDIHAHIAVTLVCDAITIVGVPVGAQIAWLENTSSGWPSDVTRVDPTTNCAVTHGPLAAGGGGNPHPAIAHGAVSVTVGWPLTSTRGFGTVGCA